MSKPKKKILAAVAVFLVVILFGGCADEVPTLDGGIAERQDGQFQFVELENDDITYLCIYTYVDGSHAGGPAMWCERLVG